VTYKRGIIFTAIYYGVFFIYLYAVYMNLIGGYEPGRLYAIAMLKKKQYFITGFIPNILLPVLIYSYIFEANSMVRMKNSRALTINYLKNVGKYYGICDLLLWAELFLIYIFKQKYVINAADFMQMLSVSLIHNLISILIVTWFEGIYIRSGKKAIVICLFTLLIIFDGSLLEWISIGKMNIDIWFTQSDLFAIIKSPESTLKILAGLIIAVVVSCFINEVLTWKKDL